MLRISLATDQPTQPAYPAEALDSHQRNHVASTR